MKNIIFFAKHLDIGGLEKALLNLLNSLDYENNRITLVLEDKQGAFLSQLDGRVIVKEYKLSNCRFVPLRRVLNLSKRILWALKNHGKYDFSCAYCTYSVIGSRLAQYASKNNCLYVHSDYTKMYPEKKMFQEFFSELRVCGFRHLVFVSQNCMENFLCIYPELSERSSVINNLVNAGEIRRRAEEPAKCCKHPGEVLFAFVGRLEESTKRLSRLLEAFAVARKKRTDIRLLIVGDGPDRGLCEEKIKEYAIESAVTLVGAQTNPYKFIAQSDCILLCSDQEGFPMVYYEALVLGKGIITTIAVKDELLDISEYAVITEKSPEAIAEAIVSFRGAEKEFPDVDKMNEIRLKSLNLLIGKKV